MLLDSKRGETAYPYRKPARPVKRYDDTAPARERIRDGSSRDGTGDEGGCFQMPLTLYRLPGFR